MAKWLFNSSGSPIAFINGENVFSRYGRFLGKLDGNEVWCGSYMGEIINDDRFLYKTKKSSAQRGVPGTPGSPGMPGLPGSKGSIGLSGSYRDVEIE